MMKLFGVVFVLFCASVFAASDKTLAELKIEMRTAKDGDDKFYAHENVVRKYASEVLDSENKTEAKELAESLLKTAQKYTDNWAYENALHHGHLVLGRINLLEKNLAGAKMELLKSVNFKRGSPQLNSFGPNMTLAKELLEKGEQKVVLKYFDNCLKFWDGDDAKAKVQEWKSAIAQKKTPDFGANLVY